MEGDIEVSDVDLLDTDIERDLRSTMRDLLADRCDVVEVTRIYDGDRSLVDRLWKSLSDIGLAGLLVPEDRGGEGASACDAAVVLEELGRAVAPVPFLTSSVIATTALLDSDAPLLGQLASGERVAALAFPWSTAPDAGAPMVRREGDRLTGSITSVAGVIEADVLLVMADSDLYAVDVSAATVSRRVCLDMTRQLADVTLDAVPGVLVLADAAPAVRRALDSGAALMASEQLGIARWCLETTVDHLQTRKQFGRVVGGFQALKHRLADLYADVESGAAAARYAAATLAAGDMDATLAAMVAQAYNSDLAVKAAEEAVQLHGGIGMTWEHPAHLYLKRAKADQIALGTPGKHRTRLGSLVGI